MRSGGNACGRTLECIGGEQDTDSTLVCRSHSFEHVESNHADEHLSHKVNASYPTQIGLWVTHHGEDLHIIRFGKAGATP